MKKLFFLGGFLLTVYCSHSLPQISITSLDFYYSENFNSLESSGTSNAWTDNSTIPGWYSNRLEYRASTGSSTAGALYSFGTASSSERALGSVASNSNTYYYAVKFVNNTLNTITQIPIQYIGEQWRYSGTAAIQTLYFDYQVNAADIVSGDWTNVPELNFIGPISSGTTGALDGNDPGNRIEISYTIPITLNSGDAIWFRFRDEDDAGSDHALAVDDFTLDATSDPMPIELTSFISEIVGSDVMLNWQTATELNNYGFDIERTSALYNKNWEKIGFVKGYGNSNSPKGYTFKDKSPKCGEYQYRLKQFDNNGSYTYSETIKAIIQQPLNFSIKNYPNPFNPSTKIVFELPVKSMVNLTVYNLIGQKIATLINEELNAGLYERNFNTTSLNENKEALPSGIYISILKAGEITISNKMVLVK